MAPRTLPAVPFVSLARLGPRSRRARRQQPALIQSQPAAFFAVASQCGFHVESTRPPSPHVGRLYRGCGRRRREGRASAAETRQAARRRRTCFRFVLAVESSGRAPRRCRKFRRLRFFSAEPRRTVRKWPTSRRFCPFLETTATNESSILLITTKISRKIRKKTVTRTINWSFTRRNAATSRVVSKGTPIEFPV